MLTGALRESKLKLRAARATCFVQRQACQVSQHQTAQFPASLAVPASEGTVQVDVHGASATVIAYGKVLPSPSVEPPLLRIMSLRC